MGGGTGVAVGGTGVALEGMVAMAVGGAGVTVGRAVGGVSRRYHRRYAHTLTKRMTYEERVPHRESLVDNIAPPFLLDQDALDFIQTDCIVGSVIQLGRARRLVVGDVLGMLDCTTVLQVYRCAGGKQSVRVIASGSPAC